MAIKLFHTPRNKRFSFTPRYYDEQKEDLDKRVKQAKQEMGIKDGESNKPYVSTIRKGEMRGYFKKSQATKKRSTIRFVVILIVLFTIVYFLLYY